MITVLDEDQAAADLERGRLRCGCGGDCPWGHASPRVVRAPATSLGGDGGAGAAPPVAAPTCWPPGCGRGTETTSPRSATPSWPPPTGRVTAASPAGSACPPTPSAGGCVGRAVATERAPGPGLGLAGAKRVRRRRRCESALVLLAECDGDREVVAVAVLVDVGRDVAFGQAESDGSVPDGVVDHLWQRRDGGSVVEHCESTFALEE